MNSSYEEIAYEEIVKNWNNRYQWKDWNKCLYIAANIPGTYIPCTLEEKIWRFVNNWQKECAVAAALHLEFYDDTHNYFHTGAGKPTPDFKDKEGKTYELKNTPKYSYNDIHWWGADFHLWYGDKTKHLYKQQANGQYIDIMPLEIELIKEI